MAQQNASPLQHPNCEQCAFFRRAANFAPFCQRHNVELPHIDWHLICRDWERDGEGLNANPLEAEMLYYFSVGGVSEATADPIYAPFMPMGQIIPNVISISVRYDKELGWILYPRRSQEHLFPDPGTRVTVLIGERKCKFQATNEERMLAASLIPTPNGAWEAQYHAQQVFMLYSLESPTLLYDWLDGYLDMQRMLRDKLIPNVAAFLVLDDQRSYTLHADTLVYRPYLR